MLVNAPDPKDVQDLQFKLHCRLKVFENADSAAFGQHCNFVACASRYGLIFLGTNSPNIQVIQLSNVEKYAKSDGDKSDYPRRILSLPSPPSHISVNCEHSMLAVVIVKNGCCCALFYDVKSFWQQEIVQICEIRLSATPSVFVTDTNWNPAVGSTFTACKSDGTLGIYEIKSSGTEINELPAAVGATCFSWSPKGKQIAVGSRDGKITQLKPDLKAVKVINPPPFNEPHSIQSLQWVSNYQFIGVFQPLRPDEQATFVVVDAPKTGEPTYTNYYDICYSNGNTRPVQFYTILLHSWNILLAASSNSMEVGVLGQEGDRWTQWIMGDAARAELPLSAQHQETLPIGLALDIGNREPLPWGEATLPPTPLLLLLSHHGTLCIFNIVNLKEGVPSLNSPPESIADTGGIKLFVCGSKQETVKPVPKEVAQTEDKPKQISMPSTNPPLSAFKLEPQIPKQVASTPPLNLFGGQATLTPVAANKSAPSLFSNVLYTEGKPPVTTVQTAATLTTQTVTKPELGASVTAAKPPQAPANEALTKNEVVSDVMAEAEAEKIFSQLLKEEFMFMECQLKAVIHDGKTLKVNVGSDEDKTKIVLTTNALEEFFKEVVETCGTQRAEVHILKQNLLQSWAWYEEAKSRHLQAQDDTLSILRRSQPLDSVSEKQLADIQYLTNYLESQISQAHGALDEQWEKFQDYCKKTLKLQIPTKELIFQTMVKQNVILSKQKYVLKDIANQIKTQSSSVQGPPLLRLTKDVSDLPSELSRLRLPSDDICQMQYEQVAEKMKKLTTPKVIDLRSFLRKRPIMHVPVVKPEMSTSILQASPPSKLKQQSWSTLKTPSVTPKKLDFVESTPLPSVSKALFGAQLPSSTPIEALQNFTSKFGATKPAEKIAPLATNAITTSANSAFISTAFSSSSVAPLKLTPGLSVVATAQDTNRPILTITANKSSSESALAATTSKNIFTPLSKSVTAVSSLPSFATPTPPSTMPINFAKVTTPSTTTSFSFLAKTTASTSVKTPTVIFGSSTFSTATTTTAPFSFSIATAPHIFGTVSSKSESSIFTSKVTTPAATTAVNLSLTSTPKVTTVATSFSSVTTVTTKTPAATPSVPLFSGKISTTSAQVASLSETKPTLIASVAPAITVASTSSGTSAPGSTSTSIFASGATSIFGGVATTKPSIFALTTSSSAVSSTFSFTSTPTTTSVFGGKETASVVSSTTTTTSQSVFGNNLSASTQSIATPTSTLTTGKTTAQTVFGSSTSTTSSIFNTPSTSTSIFATVAPTPSVFSPSTTTQSVFGSATTTTTTQSIFGSVSSTTKPIFGTAASTAASSVFGSPASTAPSVFGAPASTASSVFGAVLSTAPTAFGPAPAVSTAAPSVFGTTPSTAPSVFGSTAPTTSVFGAPASTTSSVFGAAVSTTSSVFGAPAATTSVFGAPAATTSSVFGGPTTTTSSVFGAPPATAPVFGSTSVFAATTSQSIFGGTNQTTVFGGGAATTQNQAVFGQPSVFRSSGGTFGGSTFGSSTFGQSGASVFGGTPATTSGSIFGAPSTTSSFSSFGAPASSTATPFGTSSVFSSGTNQSSPASFGFGALNLTSNTTTAGSFGTAPSTNANPFGSKSVFGNPSAASTASSAFGSSSTFGAAQPSFGSQSVFGQQASFNQPSSFGGSTFGQSAAGPFSGGSNAGVGQTGFGTSSTFQKAAGFGAAPVFGGTASFGNAPSFGSSPSFGGAPAFGSASVFGGSPSKVFGSGGGAFGGETNAQTAGFGNLANQPTVGFGNLAQQAAQGGTSPAFQGNSSFSSWR